MVDKSWGAPPSGNLASGGSTVGNLRIRSNLSPTDRAEERAKARALRAEDRAATAVTRSEARASDRAALAKEREQAREERRIAEEKLAVGDPHAAAASRRRGSGRKDVVREQRDTRAYATVVDAGRMRELARRGASLTGLAGAFGITVAEVEAVLAAGD